MVDASGTVEAVVRLTLVNVFFALEPPETRQTGALVGLIRVSASAAILTFLLEAQLATLGRLF